MSATAMSHNFGSMQPDSASTFAVMMVIMWSCPGLWMLPCLWDWSLWSSEVSRLGNASWMISGSEFQESWLPWKRQQQKTQLAAALLLWTMVGDLQAESCWFFQGGCSRRLSCFVCPSGSTTFQPLKWYTCWDANLSMTWGMPGLKTSIKSQENISTRTDKAN